MTAASPKFSRGDAAWKAPAPANHSTAKLGANRLISFHGYPIFNSQRDALKKKDRFVRTAGLVLRLPFLHVKCKLDERSGEILVSLSLTEMVLKRCYSHDKLFRVEH